MSPRPKVVLKLATSLDGRIATASGESRWITGPEARRCVHRLRAEADAVLVGSETAVQDDPELTVRLPGFAGRQPARVVLDTRQRLSPASKLAAAARETPVFLFTTGEPSEALKACGVRVEQVAADPEGRPDLLQALACLCRARARSLLVEGGGRVAAAFLRADLVDELEWFRAPMLLGADARPALGDLSLASLAAAPRFRRRSVAEVGDDLWERYERA